MRVHNQTNIDNDILRNMMRAAGVTTLGPIRKVVVRYNPKLASKANCKRTGALVVIELRDNYNLASLAHEVRHLAQYTVGLGEVMKWERQNVAYLNRAHEVDAREFAKKYA